jgi:integrase
MGIWKDKDRKEWIYKFQYRGDQYGARGFKTRREASAAREQRREVVRTQAKTIQTDTGFRTMANEYLDIAERKYVHDVYLRKTHAFRGFLKVNNDLPIEQVEPKHIHNYLKTLKGNSLYNEHRHELSALFNWVKKYYHTKFPFLINPCIGVESMTHVTAEKEIPTEKEVLMMIAASSGDERDILLTCLHTLGRIDEVLRLRWHEDVNFEKRIVILWTRKRKNGAYEPDALPMNQDLYDVLWKRWRSRKQDKWVYYNELTETRYMARPRMMHSLCERAGIKPLGYTKRKVHKGKDKGKVQDFPVYYGFHALRHFMASYLMDEKKVSLKTVSGLLRHKNLKTTEIYLHQVGEAHRNSLTGIEGKFTLEMSNPPQEAATKEIVKKGGCT